MVFRLTCSRMKTHSETKTGLPNKRPACYEPILVSSFPPTKSHRGFPSPTSDLRPLAVQGLRPPRTTARACRRCPPSRAPGTAACRPSAELFFDFSRAARFGAHKHMNRGGGTKKQPIWRVVVSFLFFLFFFAARGLVPTGRRPKGNFKGIRSHFLGGGGSKGKSKGSHRFFGMFGGGLEGSHREIKTVLGWLQDKLV